MNIRCCSKLIFIIALRFNPAPLPGPDYFSVRWRGPTEVSEFDRYQVAKDLSLTLSITLNLSLILILSITPTLSLSLILSLTLTQVAIGIRRKTPQIIERGQDLVTSFKENLRPGRTYQVGDISAV